MISSDTTLISAAQVREHFGGVSDMWLHRRQNDDSGFPLPLYIGRLRYWRVAEIRAWEETLRRKPVSRSIPEVI